jgi:GMP synthase-like glutamine amidotransferase
VRTALVLRHHDTDDAGLVGEALTARGVSIETVMVDAGHPAPPPDGHDAVIVLGSNSSVYDDSVRRAWLDQELDALARCDREGVAIFGICFGAQALCQVAGGTVERAPRGEIGWFDIDVAPGVEIPAGPWFEYHNDRCLLPASCRVLATTDHAVQVFTLERHLGVQFHPEIDDAQLERWLLSDRDEPRAHTDHESELLAETRRQTPGARQRTAELVDFFLAHAGLDARAG